MEETPLHLLPRHLSRHRHPPLEPLHLPRQPCHLPSRQLHCLPSLLLLEPPLHLQVLLPLRLQLYCHLTVSLIGMFAQAVVTPLMEPQLNSCVADLIHPLRLVLLLHHLMEIYPLSKASGSMVRSNVSLYLSLIFQGVLISSLQIHQHFFIAHNNCGGCDPVKYKIEGRADSSSAWALVHEGDLDWIDTVMGRNDQLQSISSSYSSGDTSKSFTENKEPFLKNLLNFGLPHALN